MRRFWAREAPPHCCWCADRAHCVHSSCPPAAILKQLGIINKTTRLAGASSGAINAVQACSDTSHQQAFDDNLSLAYTCKPQRNCQGFLDRALNATLSAKLSPDAGKLCAGRLWVSVTVAKPGNQSDYNLLETQWSNRQELAGTLRLSSFLPGYSAPSATLRLDDRAAIGAGYDGGFSRDLPCPPGASLAIPTESVYTAGIIVCGRHKSASGVGTSSLQTDQGIKQLRCAVLLPLCCCRCKSLCQGVSRPNGGTGVWGGWKTSSSTEGVQPGSKRNTSTDDGP